MEHKQALMAADSLVSERPTEIFASVGYQYGRWCYAVIVYGKEGTVVLVNEDAVTAYRATHQTVGAD